MRTDLDKLLCERERSQHSACFREVRNRKNYKFNQRTYDDDFDFFPRFEGIKAAHVRNGARLKSFGEHLSPLHGIVRKAIGRPFDEFFSELRTLFKPDSQTHIHIYQHLWDYLKRPKEAVVVDGILYERGYFNGAWTPVRHFDGDGIPAYVDEEGIIRACPNEPGGYQKQRRKTRAEHRDHVDRVKYIVSDALWFTYDARLCVWLRNERLTKKDVKFDFFSPAEREHLYGKRNKNAPHMFWYTGKRPTYLPGYVTLTTPMPALQPRDVVDSKRTVASKVDLRKYRLNERMPNRALPVSKHARDEAFMDIVREYETGNSSYSWRRPRRYGLLNSEEFTLNEKPLKTVADRV